MKRCLLPILGGSLLLLSACGTEDAGPGTISTTAPLLPGVNAVEASFDPTNGVIPFPNNILFGGSTDGTLNIPVVNPVDITDPKVAMNTLDGFSTVAPISTSFGEALDPTTMAAGVSIFEIGATGATKLTQDIQYKALALATSLVIKPVAALKPATNYMVVVSNKLQSLSGKPAAAAKVFGLLKSPVPMVDAAGKSQVPGVPDASAVSLEALRQATLPVFAVANAAGIQTQDIAIAWSFKTQSLNVTLPKIMADASAGTEPYSNSAANFVTVPLTPGPTTGGLGILSGATFAAANGLPAAAVSSIGSVVIGAIPQMPYYLEGSTANPTAALTATFTLDATGAPVVKSLQPVPFLLSTPNTPGPWKVAIFQHGFTVDKSVMFGVANTLASKGFATIAIDAVLHGSRTFGIDLVNNTTGLPGADNVPDSSGKYYLNLTSLLTSKGNIQQSVADLIHLTQLLKVQTMDIVNNTTGAPGGGDGADLDVATPFVYVGHSNGGILGGVLAGVVPTTTISRYVLANPGGDYAEILKNSAAYSPIVNDGLAAKGVLPGSAAYNSFFVAAQMVVDDGDPINYASVAATKPIFLLKTTPDGVVPNLQTDELSLNLGLPQISGNNITGWPLGVLASPQAVNGFVNYTAGTHSSFLSPAASPAATTAMQTDAVTFLLGGGIATSDIAVTE